MIEKIKALVLRAADFKENDKLLLLYCGEYGKITASIRGVKKPGAKLKFAAEPFCFGEFMLSVKDGRYAVTNCTEIESFFFFARRRCYILLRGLRRRAACQYGTGKSVGAAAFVACVEDAQSVGGKKRGFQDNSDKIPA